MPMLSVLVAAVAIQTQAGRFTLPAGCSPEISKACTLIAALTQKGDFDGAKRMLRLLPAHEIKVQWDDGAVPEGSRFDFSKERDKAFREWTGLVQSSTRFTLVRADADLRVVFVPSGPVTLEWSEEGSGPRLTARIGMKRPDDIDPAGVHNGVSFAVGSYFGIGKMPIPGLVMANSDLNATQPLQPHGIYETAVAVRNLTVRDNIADAVEHHQKVPAGVPKLDQAPPAVEKGPILQGQKLNLEFLLKNSGDGELDFRLIPDCSCFTRTRGVIKPGATNPAKAIMDTTEFPGEVHKKLYLFTNDPVHPFVEIPVTVQITRRFRLLPSVQMIVADSDSISVDAYLYAPPDNPIHIKAVSMQGMPATVAYKEWSGDLADPDLGESAQPRKGYKFTVGIKDIPLGTRLGTNLVIETDDENIPQVMYPIYFQRGILAPPSVFLGEIGAAPRKPYFMLSRPGKPFKIRSVTTDSAHLAANAEPTGVGEYKVTLAYDGKAPSGDYQSTVTILTDDPAQPRFEVPVRATVR